MCRLGLAISSASLLLASGALWAEEPKSKGGVGEVLRRILQPTPQPPAMPTATAAAQGPVRLVPSPLYGNVRTRFSLDADASIPAADANLQLVSVPSNSAYQLEIGVNVAVEGVRLVEFDCQLLEIESYRSGRDGRSARVKAVNRLVHQVNGPFSGRLVVGFAPFEPVGPVDMLGNPIRYPAAVCRMEASGSARGSSWSTHTTLTGDISRVSGSADFLGLFDQGTGARLQSQQLVTRAETTLVAVPEAVATAYQ